MIRSRSEEDLMKFQNYSYKNAPVIRVEPPGPRSKELLDFQSANESAAVSYPKGLPMAARRAKGATVEDVDGNIYIDFFGGAGVMNVGHSHPDVLKAAASQMKDMTHALDIPNPIRRNMVETLHSVLPAELDRVFFAGPTGSDAVEAALKLAKLNTGRIPIIAFQGGYHGMSSGALSVTSAMGHKKGLLPLLPEIHFTPYAYCYRCPFNRTEETCSLECATYLDHILEDPHSGIDVPAAVILEAIQGEGGTVVPPSGFLPKIRSICDKHQVLMIVDEIQAGFCRTGKMFAFEHSNTLPDIITMSKALGGVGFPISALAFNHILDTWPTGKHIGTFRGNLIAYAAGQAAISFMKQSDLAGHASQLGQTMMDWLSELEKSSAIVGEVRGKGLMFGIEFVLDKDKKTPAPELAKRVRTFCLQKGLLIEIGGHFSNVARFLPPLVLTQSLAETGVGIFADAVRRAEKLL